MALVIPPLYNQAAITLVGPDGTAPYVTTIGVQQSDLVVDPVSIANAVFLAYANNLKDVTNTSMTVQKVSLTIGADGPTGSVDSDLAPIACTGGAQAGPSAMSVIARKQTGQFGRSGRGRMFLPGVNLEAGILPNGGLTTEYRDQVNTRLQAFFDDLSAGTLGSGELIPVLFHGEESALEPTVITSLVASSLVGWIRGRIR